MVELGIRVFTLILVLFTPPFTARICRHVSEFTFGDMIAYDRAFTIGNRRCIFFIHWAVYVDHETNLTARVGQQDIFHFSKTETKQLACVFGELTIHGEARVDNYLDGIAIQRERPAGVVQKINELHNKCNGYSLLFNNCEHIATNVRYTQSFCQQPDAMASVYPLVRDTVKNFGRSLSSPLCFSPTRPKSSRYNSYTKT